MAAGVLLKPGTKYGPCLESCQHIDCGMIREQAATECHICDKPIGYETRFYNDYVNGLVHALCLEEEIEAKAEGGGLS